LRWWARTIVSVLLFSAAGGALIAFAVLALTGTGELAP
jgi:hypothetical protein